MELPYDLDAFLETAEKLRWDPATMARHSITLEEMCSAAGVVLSPVRTVLCVTSLHHGTLTAEHLTPPRTRI
jgi:hypothetical protein